jgi:CDP-diacylglycerol--glycerol-3-phosphate 3-phosphatidyltransferase
MASPQATGRPAGALRHLPNALTCLRLAAIPVFVWLLARADDGESLAAALIFGLAAVTDWLDGRLARRYGVQSRFGRLVDPLADRILIGAALVLLYYHDRVPLVALLLIFGRDLVLLSGLAAAADKGYELSVIYLGKAATLVLMAALWLIMVTTADWALLVLYAGIGLSLAAGAVYLITVPRAVRAARGGEDPSRVS